MSERTGKLKRPSGLHRYRLNNGKVLHKAVMDESSASILS